MVVEDEREVGYSVKRRSLVVFLILLALTTLISGGCAKKPKETPPAAITPPVVTPTTPTPVTPQTPDTGGWTIVTLDAQPSFTNSAKIGELVVATTYKEIYYSSDGLEWTLAKKTDPHMITHLVEGNGQLIALTSIEALISSDGVSWSSAARDTYHEFQAATWVDDQYIGVLGHFVMTSTDGLKWYKYKGGSGVLGEVYLTDSSGDKGHVYHIANYDGVYYAVGGASWIGESLGNLKYAPAPEIWSPLSDSAYNGRAVLIFGDMGAYIYQDEQLKKTTIHNLSAGTIGDKFVAVRGWSGETVVSSDGQTWRELFGGAGDDLKIRAAEIVDNRLVLLCSDGKILWQELK